jgi:hypothetical protein
VARFEHANWIEFTSHRFDHTSELPEDYNAGNRFYGRDLAAFLCDRLNEKGFDLVFGDEDWGWLVDGFTPDGLIVELCVYHDADEETPHAPDWALMFRTLERRRVLVVTRSYETEIPEPVLAALRDVLRDAGVTPKRFELGDGR